MITTLTTKGINSSIPIDSKDVLPYEDQWKELLTWISETKIPITVDKNYYKLRQALIENDWDRMSPDAKLNLQFLTNEDKEIFLDKHMELMWGNLI